MNTVQHRDEVEAQAVAASQGDREAFGALYERYYDPILRYVLTRTENNLAVAEDIASLTWEKVATAIPAFEPRGNGFVAWLFTIARRTVQEHYRTMWRRPERLDGEMLSLDTVDLAAGPDMQFEAKMLKQQVAAAVRSLASAQRRCVTLRFFHGLTLAETAEVMGTNANNVKQLQHRAMRSWKSASAVCRSGTTMQTRTSERTEYTTHGRWTQRREATHEAPIQPRARSRRARDCAGRAPTPDTRRRIHVCRSPAYCGQVCPSGESTRVRTKERAMRAFDAAHRGEPTGPGAGTRDSHDPQVFTAHVEVGGARVRLADVEHIDSEDAARVAAAAVEAAALEAAWNATCDGNDRCRPRRGRWEDACLVDFEDGHRVLLLRPGPSFRRDGTCRHGGPAACAAGRRFPPGP